MVLEGGKARPFGALVLATGALANRLAVPGADASHVFTLRTLADSQAIIAKAKGAKRAVVIGASFIGLEVAASLRVRGIEVDVVGVETMPLARVLGEALGALVKKVHEEHGVRFHLADLATAIETGAVVLASGTRLPADLVVLGVGVKPELSLAVEAGLKVDRGIVVDEQLRASAPGVWAIGDVARWPDARTGLPIRVEHWVVAERMGQIAAKTSWAPPCAATSSRSSGARTTISYSQLRRARRDVGPHRRRGQPRAARRRRGVPQGRQDPRGGDDWARPGVPRGRPRDGDGRREGAGDPRAGLTRSRFAKGDAQGGPMRKNRPPRHV